MEQHYLKSSYREKLIEHLFIGELIKLSWLRGNCSLEIAKPEVDNQGYDLIAEENGTIRHIQLKTAKIGATTSYQKTHIALGRKPSGCVIWIYFDETTMQLGPFLFFGAPAGERLLDITDFKVAKHTKGNKDGVKAERPEIRQIPKSKFTVYNNIEDLYSTLFNSTAEYASEVGACGV